MKEQAKICHLTSAHPHGDVRIFVKECSSLAEHFPTVLIEINGTTETKNNVEVISLKCNYTSRLQRFTKAVNLVYKKAIEVDAQIYHIHDPELLRIALKLKKKGKKVIYDVHEDLPRQILSKHWIPSIFRKSISSFIEKYENKKAQQLDGIVTATPHIKNRFLKINPNTIDVNNYPILNELLDNTSSNNKTKNTICYIGGITKTRGIKEMVEAITDTDYKLLLAGNFLEEGLKESIIQLKGWKNITELGFLSRNKVKEVYNQSCLGLVLLHPTPNYIESLPVKMFEYMASGIPIIASNFPLWRDIVEKNNCGVCADPLNPLDIKSRIDYIINNPEEATKMGANGKKLVTEKYNWGNEKIKLINLYKQLIE